MKLWIWALILTATQADAVSVDLQSFNWRRDSRFKVVMTYDGRSVEFDGEMRDDSIAQAASEDTELTVDLRAFREPFVYVVLSSESSEEANVFLLERQSDTRFAPINSRAILGRKISVLSDLESSLDQLKAQKDWETSQSMRAMVEYFEQNPAKQMHDFLGEVENQRIARIPAPRGTAGNRGVSTPQVPGADFVPTDPNMSGMDQPQPPPRKRRQQPPPQVMYDQWGNPIPVAPPPLGWGGSEQMQPMPPQHQQQQRQPNIFDRLFNPQGRR